MDLRVNHQHLLPRALERSQQRIEHDAEEETS
jgi:hypothetical protein